jgi:hypothetical protein
LLTTSKGKSHHPVTVISKDRLYFGYSTNVHRGENLAQVYKYLKNYTLAVKRRVFGGQASGLEMRLGVGAAKDLSKPERREGFRQFLKQSGLELFSINAFPLHDFQARRVKQNVYAPSWVSQERVNWTIQIAKIFADLLPQNRQGSISTLGGTYRYWGHTSSTLKKIAVNYLKVLAALEEIETNQGKKIVLAVEPEPDTTLELAEDVVLFLEEYLIPAARRLWKRRGSPRVIETIVRRRFTVNLDTCHFSVLFHDPAQALTDLHRAGVGVGKVHVTNALSLPRPYRSRRGYQTFRAMHEPRFLHQFCGIDTQGQLAWRGKDLDELPKRLQPGTDPEVAELRTHFHVPLYLKRWKNLRTTQEETREAVLHAVRKNLCPQLVIETYTWPVLATEDRLVDGITREFRWLLKTLEGL